VTDQASTYASRVRGLTGWLSEALPNPPGERQLQVEGRDGKLIIPVPNGEFGWVAVPPSAADPGFRLALHEYPRFISVTRFDNRVVLYAG
jgi:hypothetical protein